MGENPYKNAGQPSKEPAKQRNHYSYLSGFCIGVLLTVVVLLAGTLCGKMWNVWMRQVASVSDLAAGAEEPLSDRIASKAELLLKEIDENFLFEYDDKEVEEAVYSALFEALGDKYSQYYTEEQYTTLMEKLSGTFYGIGIVMQLSEDGTHAEVVSLVEKGAALEVGVKPGDWLIEADGESLLELSLSEIVAQVRGEEGSTVHIQVYRPGEDAYYEYDVERRKIETESVYGEMLEDKTGYIRISEFDSMTDIQFEKALEELLVQGMERLVIDLRNNPGGTVDSVVNIADMLLPEGLVTYTETKDGTRTEYTSSEEQLYDGPLAVLINGSSASASEILSGAVKDYGRGTLVGTTSYGKGIVQSVRRLNDGTAVKLTVARYYTPNGICIHEIGIEPDVEVELEEEAAEDGIIEREEDNQLDEAVRILLEE